MLNCVFSKSVARSAFTISWVLAISAISAHADGLRVLVFPGPIDPKCGASGQEIVDQAKAALSGVQGITVVSLPESGPVVEGKDVGINSPAFYEATFDEKTNTDPGKVQIPKYLLETSVVSSGISPSGFRFTLLLRNRETGIEILENTPWDLKLDVMTPAVGRLVLEHESDLFPVSKPALVARAPGINLPPRAPKKHRDPSIAKRSYQA